ncbi:MAG: glycosyltransferase family 2 protein [Lachnospiraceae bacterium]|nr:glycosyltransferase family 2 protein [Lachnospiraceae bacterium]
MTRDTVSVVIPVFNARPFIREALDSVYLQRSPGLSVEIVAVDDGSTDDSRELLKEWSASHGDMDLRVLSHESPKGPALARNAGVKSASGRYIAYLDSDDLWLPEKLKTQVSFMKDTGTAFSFTSYEFGDERGKGTGRIVRAPGEIDYGKALTRTVIFTSTVVLDRELIDEKLLMMEDVPSEDTAEWWKLLKSGVRAGGIDRVFSIYRRNSGSLSANKIRACGRIWNLYRRVEGLSFVRSAFCFVQWAARATLRRI